MDEQTRCVRVADRDLQMRRVEAEAVLDLRHRILRAGLPRKTAVFEGDERAETVHLAAYHDGVVVGCLTLHPSAWQGEPAMQLRGMAVENGWQGLGVGGALLEWAQELASVPVLWCNARKPAVGFYRAHGWTVASEEFEIPTAGPHVRMVRRRIAR